jgi:hypothetical protein
VRLTDLQRLQCPIVDPASDGQLVDGLEPANRFCRFWADYAIDLTVIVTEFCQLLPHGKNGLLEGATSDGEVCASE